MIYFSLCGVDEVGRGALAGPLMAVASVFCLSLKDKKWAEYGRLERFETRFTPIEGVNDSKKVKPVKRKEVFKSILRHHQFVDFGLGEVSVKEINSKGIEWANQEAFIRAVKDLKQEPDYIMVDGTSPLMGWDIMKQKNVPKADGLWWPVGAASILAKVIRDSYMAELALDFPSYSWEKNSGYGSEEHRIALIEDGPCVHHREKFIRKTIGALT